MSVLAKLKFSSKLQDRQTQLFQKVQRMSVGTPLRKLVCDVERHPIIWCGRRSRGRPRQTWATSVFKLVRTQVQ